MTKTRNSINSLKSGLNIIGPLYVIVSDEFQRSQAFFKRSCLPVCKIRWRFIGFENLNCRFIQSVRIHHVIHIHLLKLSSTTTIVKNRSQLKEASQSVEIIAAQSCSIKSLNEFILTKKIYKRYKKGLQVHLDKTPKRGGKWNFSCVFWAWS